jgi:hypothetical protein
MDDFSGIFATKKSGYQKPKTKPLHESQGFFFQFYDIKKLGILESKISKISWIYTI